MTTLPGCGAVRRGFGASGFPVQADSVVQFVTEDGEILPFDEAMVLPYDERDSRKSRKGRPALRDVEIDGVRYRMITVDGPGGLTFQIARSLAELVDSGRERARRRARMRCEHFQHPLVLLRLRRRGHGSRC